MNVHNLYKYSNTVLRKCLFSNPFIRTWNCSSCSCHFLVNQRKRQSKTGAINEIVETSLTPSNSASFTSCNSSSNCGLYTSRRSSSSSNLSSLSNADVIASIKFDHLSFEPPVPHEDLLALLGKCKTISEQMEILVSTLSLPPHDIENRKMFCRTLEQLFKPFFNKFKIQIFGSTVNCYGFRGCDMDMTFETGGLYKNEKNYLDIPDVPLISEVLSGKVTPDDISDLPVKEQLLFLHNVLLEYYNESENPPIYINAHVPLVRFHFDKCDLKCDLTFENRDAYGNTKLLYLYGQLDKRVIPLMMTLRYWAKHVELIGKGLMFNTYTISLLVVYFLQSVNPPILPSAEYITSLSNSFEINDMDDKSFLDILDKIPPSKNTSNLEELLKEFFVFYLFFDFTRVVCPLIGKAVPREEFFTEDRSKKFKMNSICVQDPMCLTHNVADLVDFKTCKKLSTEVMFACETFNDESTFNPSNEPWGIMKIFDKSEDSLKSMLRKVYFAFDVPLPSNSASITVQERTSPTECLLKILRNALLFEYKILQPEKFLDLLKEQDKFIIKRKREVEKIIATKRELSSFRVQKKAEVYIPEDIDHLEVSMIETFNEFNDKHELIYCLQCKASQNTWLGRNCLDLDNLGDGDVLRDFLTVEGFISQQAAKRNAQNSVEKIKPFIFLCEVYISRDSPQSSIILVLKPFQKVGFNPILGNFLKLYLPDALNAVLNP